MDAIDMLNKVPAAAVDYEKLFEQQMTELKTLKFPDEIIESFRQKKDSLLKYISKNHKKNCIPFIPAVPVRIMKFIEQFQKISAHYSSTGDIYGTLNSFFYNEKKACDISGANLKYEVYFLVNINIENCPEKIEGCKKMKKDQEIKNMDITNHAESLMLAHFATDIFSSYDRILTPGLSWDDHECAYIYKSRNFIFGIEWENAMRNDPEKKTCLVICENRL